MHTACGSAHGSSLLHALGLCRLLLALEAILSLVLPWVPFGVLALLRVLVSRRVPAQRSQVIDLWSLYPMHMGSSRHARPGPSATPPMPGVLLMLVLLSVLRLIVLHPGRVFHALRQWHALVVRRMGCLLWGKRPGSVRANGDGAGTALME